MISSRKYSWYDRIRAGDWWNKIQMIKQDVSTYKIIMVINWKSDVKSDENNSASIQRIHSWNLLLLLLLVLPRCLDM